MSGTLSGATPGKRRKVRTTGSRTFTGTASRRTGPPAQFWRQHRLTSSWNGSPFGRSFRTQLTYGEIIDIYAGLGTMGIQVFSIGGVYDPNITSGGHQPRFYDTLCGASGGTAPYRSYRVLSSKITATFFPIGTDSVEMRGCVGLGAYESTSTAPTTLNELLERSDFVSKFLGYWAGGTDKTILSRSTDNKKFFDVADVKDADNLAGVYNANPSRDGNYALVYVPQDQTSDRHVKAFVKIVYTVEFFNRNDVADS